jgi:hypothetical protein
MLSRLIGHIKVLFLRTVCHDFWPELILLPKSMFTYLCFILVSWGCHTSPTSFFFAMCQFFAMSVYLGVAAFGFQDLGFRTSINGHCSLLLLQPCFYNVSVLAFGSQDLGFRTSLACVSPPPQPAAPKCNVCLFATMTCSAKM